MSYTVFIFKEEEGGYWASVPELPGCATQGDSVEEIKENIKDAIEEYLHALEFAGRPIPPRAEAKFEVAVA